MDIVDVWFDSGSTHSFVLEDRDDLSWPAALYLKGPTSIADGSTIACWKALAHAAARPMTAVLTHGFVLDEDGYKMSKSRGNTTHPSRGDRPTRGGHSAPVGGVVRHHR